MPISLEFHSPDAELAQRFSKVLRDDPDYAAEQRDLRARLEEEAREKIQEIKRDRRVARDNDDDDDDDDHDVEIVYEP